MASKWSLTTVGEIARRVTKGTTPTTIGSRFVDTGIAFVKVESITKDGRLDKGKLAFIDDRTNQILTRSMLQRDDVLFTIAGTIGRVARVTQSLLPANTNQAVAIVRPDLDLVDSRFLYYVLRDDERVKHAQTRVVQSVQANFSLSELSSIEVPLPPIEEQRVIARILGALDDRIESSRRMNETLEEMARAIFKSWFVDFDPVRAKSEGRDPGLPKHIADLFPDHFENFEDLEIPAGWNVGTLANYAELNPESWSNRNAPQEVVYVDLATTKWGRIEQTQRLLWKETPSRARRVLRSGDTIVGTVRPGNGTYSYIAEEGLTGSTGFAVLRPRESKYREFVYLGATSLENIDRLTHLADGAAYPAVRSDVVLNTKTLQPTEPLLEYFSHVVKPFLSKVSVSRREVRAIAAIRDMLLPKLVSGKIRVARKGSVDRECS